MALINWYTGGTDTSVYETIMWKSGFSVYYNPEREIFWFYIWSYRIALINVTS
jgi:hypothetical protein